MHGRKEMFSWVYRGGKDTWTDLLDLDGSRIRAASLGLPKVLQTMNIIQVIVHIIND